MLEVGTDLIENERIETSETGRAHLLFRDGSFACGWTEFGPGAGQVSLRPEKPSRGKILFSTAKRRFSASSAGGSANRQRLSSRRRLRCSAFAAEFKIFSYSAADGSAKVAHIFGNASSITRGDASRNLVHAPGIPGHHWSGRIDRLRAVDAGIFHRPQPEFSKRRQVFRRWVCRLPAAGRTSKCLSCRKASPRKTRPTGSTGCRISSIARWTTVCFCEPCPDPPPLPPVQPPNQQCEAC